MNFFDFLFQLKSKIHFLPSGIQCDSAFLLPLVPADLNIWTVRAQKGKNGHNSDEWAQTLTIVLLSSCKELL
jgi:hypothetical protein